MKDKIIGATYAISACALYGLGTVQNRTLSQTAVDPRSLCLHIFLVGSVLHIAFFGKIIRSDLGAVMVKPTILIILGSICSLLPMILIFWGLTTVNASTSSLLLQTDLIGCALFGFILLNDRIDFYGWLGIGLVLIGAGWFSGIFSLSYSDFNIYSICINIAGLLFGIGIVLNRMLSVTHTAALISLSRNLIPFFLLCPFVPNYIHDIQILSHWEILNLTILGLTNFFLAFLLISKSCEKLEPWLVGMVLQLMPFFTIIFAKLLLNESLINLINPGLLLILFGVGVSVATKILSR